MPALFGDVGAAALIHTQQIRDQVAGQSAQHLPVAGPDHVHLLVQAKQIAPGTLMGTFASLGHELGLTGPADSWPLGAAMDVATTAVKLLTPPK